MALEGQDATKSKDNSQIVASQMTSILQLTEQVNEIKQMNKMFLTHFYQLAKQMAALLATNTNTSPNQCQAGGHTCGYGQAT